MRLGFTLLEVLVGVFILALVAIAVAGLAGLGVRSVVVNEARVVAAAIANEELENIRALDYDDVGYEPTSCQADPECDDSGPDGTIIFRKTAIRNGTEFVVTTRVTLVDEQDISERITGALTEEKADYKQVNIEVSLPGERNADRDVKLVSLVSPKYEVPDGPGPGPGPGPSPPPSGPPVELWIQSAVGNAVGVSRGDRCQAPSFPRAISFVWKTEQMISCFGSWRNASVPVANSSEASDSKTLGKSTYTLSCTDITGASHSDSVVVDSCSSGQANCNDTACIID